MGARGWFERVRSTFDSMLKREGDDPAEMLRKEFVACVGIAGAFCSIVWVRNGCNYDAPFHIWAGAVAAALYVLVLIAVFVTKRCSLAQLYAFICFLCVVITLADISGHPDFGMRSTGMFIVTISILFVLDVSDRFIECIVVYVVLYLMVVEAEAAFRYGLFDYPGQASDEVRTRACNCDNPPCGSSVGEFTNAWATQATPFVVNYFLARSFAVRTRDETAKVQASVSAAEALAACLVRFDLSTASKILAEHKGALPDELHVQFNMLLYNIGSYRPYLPQSLLERQASSNGSSDDACNELYLRPGTEDSADVANMAADDTCSSTGSSALSGRSFSFTPRNVALQEPAPVVFPRGAVSSTGSFLVDSGAQLRMNFLKATRIALVQLTAKWADETPEVCPNFGTRHTTFIASALEHLTAMRGVIDAFDGDTITGSFNAAKPNALYSMKALEAVKAFIRAEKQHAKGVGDDNETVSVTAVLLAGPAYVGALGTPELKRPVVIGPLPGAAAQTTRYCLLRGHEAVCNAAVYGDTHIKHALRVILDSVIFDTKGCTPDGPEREAKPMVLFSILVDDESAAKKEQSVETTEWMYQIADEPGKHWEKYNEAGRVYFSRGTAAARQLSGAERETFQRAMGAAARVDFRPRLSFSEDGVVGVSATSKQDELTKSNSISSDLTTTLPLS